jgi:hypothetical protein
MSHKSAVAKRRRRQRAPRGFGQYGSDPRLLETLGGSTMPSARVLFEAIYGADWCKRVSLVFGLSMGSVRNIAYGGSRIPDYMLHAFLETSTTERAISSVKRGMTARFERQLADQLAQLRAAGRWLWLLQQQRNGQTYHRRPTSSRALSRASAVAVPSDGDVRA